MMLKLISLFVISNIFLQSILNFAYISLTSFGTKQIFVAVSVLCLKYFSSQSIHIYPLHTKIPYSGQQLESEPLVTHYVHTPLFQG